MPESRTDGPGAKPRRAKKGKEAGDIFAAATPQAAEFLVGVMNDEKATFSVRMDAAKTILDRVYGRAAQLTGESGGRIEVVMDEEVRKLLE